MVNLVNEVDDTLPRPPPRQPLPEYHSDNVPIIHVPGLLNYPSKSLTVSDPSCPLNPKDVIEPIHIVADIFPLAIITSLDLAFVFTNTVISYCRFMPMPQCPLVPSPYICAPA